MNTSIAIIEDDGPIRGILSGWMDRTEGYRTIGCFESAESALIGLPALRPDVVLADINLPGMSGIECVRTLKSQLPATHFIMLTVYEDADHIFDALAAGAVGYLLKRTPREELFAALQEVQTGGSPMSSSIARKVVQSFQRPLVESNEAKLSPREREVLDKLAGGFLYKEIADGMNLSLPTVNTYVRRIYEKLHVHSRSQAVARYVKGR
ncbi:MAG: response regulator transcription factor [Opitutus sp.]